MAKLITTVLLAASLTACQQGNVTMTDKQPNSFTHSDSNQAQPLKHRWRVVKFMNYSASALKDASLDLTTYPRANLYAGCNQIMFSVKANGTQFITGEMMSTRMACINDTLENDLSNALRQVTSYEITDNMLTLKTGNKLSIVLAR